MVCCVTHLAPRINEDSRLARIPRTGHLPHGRSTPLPLDTQGLAVGSSKDIRRSVAIKSLLATVGSDVLIRIANGARNRVRSRQRLARRVVDEHRRFAGQHIVRVQALDCEVVRGRDVPSAELLSTDQKRTLQFPVSVL